MEENWGYRTKLIWVSLGVTIFCVIASLFVMISYAGHKTIIITEDEPVDEVENSDDKENVTDWVLNIDSLADSTGYITFALPQGATAGDVSMSVRYDICAITLTVDNTKDTFFISNPPRGNFEHVEKLRGNYSEGKTTMVFELDCVCEAKLSFASGNVCLEVEEFCKPDSTVVVLDAGHGGKSFGIRAGELSEKDVTLKIAQDIEKLTKDRPYKVMLIRNGDESMTTDQRLETATILFADYFVGIHLSSDMEDSGCFGMSAYYNPSYYHNGFENVNFADVILKNAATASSNRAIGVFEAGEDELPLKVIDIPAVYFYAGYMTNSEEAKLLSSDEYLLKIAQGIVNALDEVIK